MGRLKIAANIATRPGRELPLKRCIESLHGQVDEIRIYFNDFEPYEWLSEYPKVRATKGKDLGAAAKFANWNPKVREYYFTCDDDLIYPPNYVKRTIDGVKKYGGIITYHGRILNGKGLKYYGGHQVFLCLKDVAEDVRVHIGGTGVSCFISDTFNRPVGDLKYKLMDDILTGLYAAQQDVPITLLAHKEGWLKMSPEGQQDGIWQQHHSKCDVQNQLADEVWEVFSKPVVSVIIPYREDRGWLDIARASARWQDYPNIEVIESTSPDNVSTNLNNGIRQSTGQLITYLCDDDYLPMGAIAAQVQKIKQGYDFIHGNAVTLHELNVTKDWNSPNPKPTLESLKKHNTIHGGTVMYRRSVFDRVGYFDESLNTCEEYEFNLRCLAHGLRLGFTHARVYGYRRHDAQKSLGKGVDQSWRDKVRKEVQARY